MVENNETVATPSNEVDATTQTANVEAAPAVLTQTQDPVTPQQQTAENEVKEKVFTQAQLDDIVVSRLGKEKVRILKKFGVDDESDIANIIEKAQKYETTQTELQKLQAEKTQMAYVNALNELNVDKDFTEFVLSKIDKGDTLEAFVDNAKQYLEANPKFKSDTFKQVNSSLDLGGTQAYPDFSQMTPEQYLAWRAKNKL
jgi:hypothetical protein